MEQPIPTMQFFLNIIALGAGVAIDVLLVGFALKMIALLFEQKGA